MLPFALELWSVQMVMGSFSWKLVTEYWMAQEFKVSFFPGSLRLNVIFYILFNCINSYGFATRYLTKCIFCFGNFVTFQYISITPSQCC